MIEPSIIRSKTGYDRFVKTYAGVPRDGCEDGSQHGRGRHARDRARCEAAVEPGPRAGVVHAIAEQQEQSCEEQRVEGDPEDVAG